MNSRIKSLAAVALTVVLCACANPYADEINRLDSDYAAGKISKKQYVRQRRILEQDAADQNRRNTDTAIIAAGTAAAVTGAVLEANARDDRPPGGAPAPQGGPGPGGPR